jgi:F-box protein 25/32
MPTLFIGHSLYYNSCVTVSFLQLRLSSTLLFRFDFQRHDDGKVTMSDLPDEVIRHILVQLADHRDLVHASLTESRTFALCKETTFWRNLCYFHFTSHMWGSVLRKTESVESVGWKNLYVRLMK